MLHVFTEASRWYSTALAQADPRVEHLPLAGSPGPMLLIVAFYIFIIYNGPRWMEPYKPITMRPLLVLYNFLMVALSMYVFLETTVLVVAERFSLVCQPVDYSNSYKGLTGVKIGWSFFFLKVIELADTVFFVLRKKNSQITFLHVYHHATMVIATWLGMKFVPGGQSFLHPMINSLVHVVMYTYYGIAAIGPHMQKYLWWKRYLTVFQLTQFIMMLLHSTVNLVVECNFPKIFDIVVLGYASSIFLLFINFYYRAYIQRKESRRVKSQIYTNGKVD